VPDANGVLTLQGALDPVDSDHDYYVFTGESGILYVATDSKPISNEYDPAYPDLVVSLYDNQRQLIARNDDAFPRTGQDSVLITALTSNGTYYLEVEEFCQFQQLRVLVVLTGEATSWCGACARGPGAIPPAATRTRHHGRSANCT
jgi:hypothetical protein